MIDKILHWIRKVTEVGICLIALSVVAEILFGVYTPFFPPVTENIIFFVAQLGSECWNWNDKPPLKRLNILWSLIPFKYLEYNRKGIYIQWQ